MKKYFLTVVLLAALLIGALPATAVPKQQPAYKYVWEKLGGDPRQKGGVHSWEEYRKWFLSPGGQNDLQSVKLPEAIRFRMTKLVENRRWNEHVVFADGSYAASSKMLIPKGTILDLLTFNRWMGIVWEKVLMAFNARAYCLTVTEADGTRWRMDTFEECANAGRIQTLLTVTPHASSPPPPATPRVTSPFPEETPQPRYSPPNIGYVEVGKAARMTVTAKGIFPAIADVLGRWLGRSVTNTNFTTGPVYGSTASGGTVTGGSMTGGNMTNGAVTATTAPITVTQGSVTANQSQGQQQQSNNSNANNNQNINPINVVNGNNSAGSASGAGSQQNNGTQQGVQNQ